MISRTLLATAILATLSQAQTRFTVVEATIPEMQAALAAKRTTSRDLVTQYLVRIALYDRVLHSLVTVNPKALAEADACDRERAAGKLRGPLHGIPIALKDNIHANGMPTTGGALAFANLIPPYEATLTRNLVRFGDAPAVVMLARPTALQRHAFDKLAIAITP